MFFGEIKTELSLGGVLSSSIEVYKNKNKIKISKGTIINKVLVDLLLLNKIEHIKCAKLDDDEIDENTAVHEISKNIITSKNSNIKIQDPKHGRCNLISCVDGIIVFQQNQLFSASLPHELSSLSHHHIFHCLKRRLLLLYLDDAKQNIAITMIIIKII